MQTPRRAETLEPYMSTTLEPSFLAACLTIGAFKNKRMLAAQGGLIGLALTRASFTAADLPESIVGGSSHLSGAATGSLISIGILTVVGRVKSPKPNAHGRKLDQLSLADGKRATALAFLRSNDLPHPLPEAGQLSLAV